MSAEQNELGVGAVLEDEARVMVVRSSSHGAHMPQ